MKIGIVGSGAVATTLGGGFLRHGHEVALGTREPAKLADWREKNTSAAVKSFAEAAAFGEVVVLAVGGAVALDALGLVGAGNIAGKIIIDACNPIGGGPPVNGVLSGIMAQTSHSKKSPSIYAGESCNSPPMRNWGEPRQGKQHSRTKLFSRIRAPFQ